MHLEFVVPGLPISNQQSCANAKQEKFIPLIRERDEEGMRLSRSHLVLVHVQAFSARSEESAACRNAPARDKLPGYLTGLGCKPCRNSNALERLTEP